MNEEVGGNVKRCVEINFHLNLILNYEACKLSEGFLKFVLAIFPAKSCCKFCGLGCGRAKGPSPLSGHFDSRTPTDDDHEGGADYLLRVDEGSRHL